jgi:hypothetical protein
MKLPLQAAGIQQETIALARHHHLSFAKGLPLDGGVTCPPPNFWCYCANTGTYACCSNPDLGCNGNTTTGACGCNAK